MFADTNEIKRSQRATGGRRTLFRAAAGSLLLLAPSTGVFATGIVFKPPVDYPVGASAGAVAVADLNRDGRVDLAIANLGDATVSVLLGNGDGTFRPKVDYPAGDIEPEPREPFSLAVDDFNRDGRPDLITANTPWHDGTWSTISVLLGRGDGTFKPKTDFTTGDQPNTLVTADLNRDGKPDLITANDEYQGNAGLSVLLGNGSGGVMGDVGYIFVSDYGGPTSVVAVDLNRDGKLDLAAPNPNQGEVVSVLLGKGTGAFQPQADYPSGSATEVAVGDFNRDGLPDLATNGTGLLLGKSGGGFRPPLGYPPGVTAFFGLAVADFDRDGRPDLATTAAQVLLGKGDGTFRAALSFTTGEGPRAIAVGDFDRDGRVDLVTVNSNNTVSVVLNARP